MHGVGYGFLLHDHNEIGGMSLTILGFLMLLTIASLKLLLTNVLRLHEPFLNSGTTFALE